MLTHCHVDHTGFAGDFARRGVPVYIHEDDAEKIRPGRRDSPPQRLTHNLWRPSVMSVMGEAMMDAVFTQPPIEGARTFTDGQVLDVPAHLRVVHVPGHSEGSCALHHPGLDLMFTGDTLMTYDPMFGGDVGPIVFAEDPANDEICLRNLELLRPFESAGILPAHGEPDTRQGALGNAITHARIAPR